MKSSCGNTTHPLKALDILEGLASCTSDVSVSELAEITNLSVSTVYRLLMELTERQYVIRDERTKTYRLGLGVLTLASAVLDKLEIKHIARSALRTLADITGETIHLFCPDGMEAVYIDKIDTPNPIGLKSQIGKRLPLYCTAGGKAILAHKGDAFIKTYIDTIPMHPFTEKTIQKPQQLFEELKRIQQNGYAVDNEEHHSNITCIAAPLLNKDGTPVGSISISGPSYRFPLQKALEYKDALIECSKSISSQLI